MKTVLRIILTIIILASLIYGIGWKLMQNKAKRADQISLSQTRNSAIPVTTTAVSSKSFSNNFTVNGAFQPSRQMMMISDVAGKITKLNIKGGSYVKAGEVILTVDSEYLENDLEGAELNLKKAEKDLERMKNLIGDGGVTQAQYEQAEVAVENVKVKIKSLKKRLGDTQVKAPISGFISQKRVEMGSVLGPGAPIAMLVDINPIVLIVFLTENQVITIKKGQQAEVSVDVYGNKILKGKVTFIDVLSDNFKRYMVKVELSNPSDMPIKAGMSGKARFTTNQDIDALILPRTAFLGSLLDGRVFVIENGKAKSRQVKTGAVFADQVEIIEGLQEGDEVVLSGKANLEDGVTVQIMK